MTLDVKLVDAISEENISFTLIGWHLLEIITMLFNEKRRALRDFIVGTATVRI